MTHRSRLWRFLAPSYRRLAIVLVAMVMLAGSVVGLTVGNLASAEQPLDRIDPRLLAASSHLEEAARGLAAVSSTFTQGLALPPDQRTVAASGVAAASSQYQGAFHAYEADSVDLPGEKELEQRFLKLTTDSGRFSVELLGVPEVVSRSARRRRRPIRLLTGPPSRPEPPRYRDRASCAPVGDTPRTGSSRAPVRRHAPPERNPHEGNRRHARHRRRPDPPGHDRDRPG